MSFLRDPGIVNYWAFGLFFFFFSWNNKLRGSCSPLRLSLKLSRVEPRAPVSRAGTLHPPARLPGMLLSLGPLPVPPALTLACFKGHRVPCLHFKPGLTLQWLSWKPGWIRACLWGWQVFTATLWALNQPGKSQWFWKHTYALFLPLPFLLSSFLGLWNPPSLLFHFPFCSRLYLSPLLSLHPLVINGSDPTGWPWKMMTLAVNFEPGPANPVGIATPIL